MGKILRDLILIVVLSLVVGTLYNASTKKLEFWVRASRYPDALICNTQGQSQKSKVSQPQNGALKNGKATKTKGVSKTSSQSKPGPKKTTPQVPKKATSTQEVRFAGSEGPLASVRLLGFEETEAAWRDGILFIDARSKEAYQEGHIPGAISIPAWEPGLEKRIQQLAEKGLAGRPVVVYCTHANECEDSKIVASNLVDFGFMDVSIYEGGFGEWAVVHKKPFVKGPKPGPRGNDYGKENSKEASNPEESKE